MKLTCVCGYSVDTGYEEVEDITYFQSGRRKGEVKEVKKVWKQIDPDKPQFLPITMEKGFKFEVQDGWYTKEVELYACPECHTVKVVV